MPNSRDVMEALAKQQVEFDKARLEAFGRPYDPLREFFDIYRQERKPEPYDDDWPQ